MSVCIELRGVYVCIDHSELADNRVYLAVHTEDRFTSILYTTCIVAEVVSVEDVFHGDTIREIITFVDEIGLVYSIVCENGATSGTDAPVVVPVV